MGLRFFVTAERPRESFILGGMIMTAMNRRLFLKGSASVAAMSNLTGWADVVTKESSNTGRLAKDLANHMGTVNPSQPFFQTIAHGVQVFVVHPQLM